MKVYVFRKNGMFCEELGAFINFTTAKMRLCSYLEYNGNWDDLGKYHLEEHNLPFVGRHVYYLHYYKGYGYNYYNGSIYDVSADEGLFACKDHCKQSDLWKECMHRISLKDRDDYLITDGGIGCADDCFEDSLFTYGDEMENKWSLTIDKIRVNKSKEMDEIL